MTAVLKLVPRIDQSISESQGRRMQMGFTAVPNDIKAAKRKARLTSWEWFVVDVVESKTFGFNKPEDDITISQIAREALDDGDSLESVRGNVSKAFNALINRNILSARKGKHGFVVSINSPEEWKDRVQKKAAQNVTTVLNRHTRLCQINTHNIQPQKTTTPPVVPQGETPAQPAAKPKRERKTAITLKAWLETIQSTGEQAIPADDPIFADAEKTGIPIDFLRICWLEFRDRYHDGDRKGKRYADWRATFRNAVRDNWFKLWAINADGECFLTTQGTLAMRRFKGDGE